MVMGIDLLWALLTYCALFSAVYGTCWLRFELQMVVARWHYASIGATSGTFVLRVSALPDWKELVGYMRWKEADLGHGGVIYRDTSSALRVHSLGAVVPPDLYKASVEGREAEWLKELGVGARRGYWSCLFWRYGTYKKPSLESKREVVINGLRVIFYFAALEPHEFFAMNCRRGILYRDVSRGAAGGPGLSVTYIYPAPGRKLLLGPDAVVSPALSEYARAVCEHDMGLLESVLGKPSPIEQELGLLEPLGRLSFPGLLDRLAGYCYAYPQAAW